jgi:hypothetical protein
MLGLSLTSFTILHVFIGLVALAAGTGLAWTMLRNHDSRAWAYTFFAGILLTDATAFMFPGGALSPGGILGMLSLTGLALAVFGYRTFQRTGRLRALYVVASIVILYFNALVTVFHAFLQVPSLRVFAPHGNEPPLVAAESMLLLAFVVLGWAALRAFDPDRPHEEDLIDESLEESFPASDPPAVDPPHAR